MLHGRGFDGPERQEGRTKVTHFGEQAVQLGLVGHGSAQGGGAVVVVAEGHAAEPGRPVLVEMPIDAELVVA
ncbi:MAG: hypothetical protein WA962_14290 [Ornithinimicrobium sp.]